jgi:hypothetical protein
VNSGTASLPSTIAAEATIAAMPALMPKPFTKKIGASRYATGLRSSAITPTKIDSGTTIPRSIAWTTSVGSP